MSERLGLLWKRNGMLCSWEQTLPYLESMNLDNLDVDIFPPKGKKQSDTFQSMWERTTLNVGNS